jgi:hypothetical protein
LVIGLIERRFNEINKLKILKIMQNSILGMHAIGQRVHVFL